MTDSEGPPVAVLPEEQRASPTQSSGYKRQLIALGVAISAVILFINVIVVVIVSRDQSNPFLRSSNDTNSNTGNESIPTKSPVDSSSRPITFRTEYPTPYPTLYPTIDFTPSPTREFTSTYPLGYTPYPSRPPTTSSPTRRETNQAAVVWFINNVTLTNRTISANSYSNDDYYFTDDNYLYETYVTEEGALTWMIHKDPLQLLPFSLEDQFRMTQRYVLITLGLKPLYTDRDLSNETVRLMIEDECSWDGVTCAEIDLGNDTGLQNVVTELNSTANTNLKNHFAADIGLLSHLTRLHVETPPSYTTYSTTIPETVGRLTNLEYFNVSTMSGSLFPESMRSWTRIRIFSARSTSDYFYSECGTLPAFIGEWSNLEVFELIGCPYMGQLPLVVGLWTNLTKLVLSENGFTGELPSSIAQLSHLEYVDISSNQFMGSLPKAMASWTDLQTAIFAANAFTGSLPAWVGQWERLEYMDVTSVGMNGTLPDEIGKWSNAISVLLSSNAFTGTLPQSIGQWTNLEEFSIQWNMLNGTIPDSISNWTAIRKVYLDANDLTGTVPTDICLASNLTTLHADCMYDVLCQCCSYCAST